MARTSVKRVKVMMRVHVFENKINYACECVCDGEDDCNGEGTL